MSKVEGSIFPNRGRGGDRFYAAIRGDKFTKVTNVQLGPGIDTSDINVIRDGNMELRISIAADAAIGLRDIVFTDPTGTFVLSQQFEVVQ